MLLVASWLERLLSVAEKSLDEVMSTYAIKTDLHPYYKSSLFLVC